MQNFITDVDIIDESKECFLTYAEEVLTDRAIPSAEDGLLSVHRKILWTIENVLKMTNKSKYKKSASIVGSTLASSYFHGDAACYGALCKLAQKYLMRYPLIDGDGNFGTQEGNGMEAASRYTNAKPSEFADLMYTNYNKNVVPVKSTYNEEYMEPVVLPALFPNAIANGRESIGIGMSHNSLPHNLTEVCNAIIKFIELGSLTIDELLNIMPGPDFPLGNVVINSKDIKEAYKTGHSTVSLKVQGDYEIKGNEIIFNTIPYRTYRNKIKEQINKNIDVLENYIEDFRDESNVGVNKLIFVVKGGIEPAAAINKLFALTDLQTSLSYNMNFIVNGTPRLCSMVELIQAYVNHQTNVLLKACEYDLNKAEAKKHILDGILIALGDIDKAIELIKTSKDKNEAIIRLMGYFAIDDVQAKAILDMKLSRLTKLDKEELEKELLELIEIINDCNKTISDKNYRDNKIIKLVENLKKKYGDTRRTKLLNVEIKREEKEKETIIPEEVMVVINGVEEIKRVSKKNFKLQHRKGVGVKTLDKTILSIVSTNTVDNLMIFTSKGKMFILSVDKIPEGSNLSKGINLRNLIKLDDDDKIQTAVCASTNDFSNIVFFTKLGYIKKTLFSEYSSMKKTTGIQAIKLKGGDEIIKVVFMEEENVILMTSQGLLIRVPTDDVKAIGRLTYGVKGITLKDNDYVVSAFNIKDINDITIITREGKGKRIPLKNISVQNRGGKGLSYIKLDPSDSVAAAIPTESDSTILIAGKPNSICIPAQEISEQTRLGTGIKLIEGSIVQTAVRL